MSEDGIRESTRQTLLTLWNVFSFFVTYADLDGWRPDPEAAPPRPTHVLDRWVRGERDATVAEATEALEGAGALAGFERGRIAVTSSAAWNSIS